MNHIRDDSTLIQELNHNLHHNSYSKVCLNKTLIANPEEDM